MKYKGACDLQRREIVFAYLINLEMCIFNVALTWFGARELVKSIDEETIVSPVSMARDVDLLLIL